MKTIIYFLSILLFAKHASAQKLISGEYESGLKLAYDPKTNQVSGYYESYSGSDEENNSPRFSCIFFIEGKLNGKLIKIKSYYPTDKTEDLIEGTLELLTNKSLKIKLTQEHGGCWNVQHFADEAPQFELIKKTKWIMISYIISDKSYFYQEKSLDKKLKSYLVKGDFVCVEKIENDWAYCTYFGKKTISDWIRVTELYKTN